MSKDTQYPICTENDVVFYDRITAGTNSYKKDRQYTNIPELRLPMRKALVPMSDQRYIYSQTEE